jgi:hypothetical protein
MRIILIGVACALFATTTCVAQDVVGTSVVKGRTVELLSDYSWHYKDQATTACRAIKSPVSFCGESLGWKYVPRNNDTGVAAMFQHDDTNYGEFIVEHIGASTGVTMDTMRGLVLSNAATFMGRKPEEVVTVGDDPVTVDGFTGETLIYKGVAGKLPFVFYNTIVITPSDTAQIATFSVGTEATDEGRHLHRQFLEQTHLK